MLTPGARPAAPPGRTTGSTERPFLGCGWRFPIVPDAHGRLRWSEGDASIESSIWNILSTAPGERVLRPAFGCALADLLFETNTDLAHGAIAAEVGAALVRWEPRVDVLGVDVEAPTGGPHVMLVRVHYRVRSTNTVHNLVYPLFVTEGRG